MKKFAILTLVLAIAILAFWFFGGIYYRNAEVKLRNLSEAQGQSCQAFHDVMWKTIKQVAGVPDHAADKFKDIYVPLMEGRYSGEGKGQLMMWVQEQNPQFDLSLYAKVQEVVEAKRTEFFVIQQKWIDVHRQHKDLLRTEPASWFVGDRDTLPITVITSTTTEDAYRTGKDDNVDLY